MHHDRRFRYFVLGGLLLFSVLGFALLWTSTTRGRANANLSADWPHFGYDASFTADNTVESTLNVTNVAKWNAGGASVATTGPSASCRAHPPSRMASICFRRGP